MSTDDKLASARASGDRDRLATALVEHATQLVDAGSLGEARPLLDEAARIHNDASRPVDEGRCLVFAATLCRMLGKLDMAESRARRADKIAPADSAPSVSACAELAEIAVASGRLDVAVDAYDRAYDRGAVAGLRAIPRAALLRRKARTLAALERHDDTLTALLSAHQTLVADGEHAEARRVDLEYCSMLCSLGHTEAPEAVASAKANADRAEDIEMLTELALLEASLATEADDLPAAIEASERARQHALGCDSTSAYAAAALALGQLYERSGDAVAAYGALAVGWVTLGDALGKDVAKATFEPALTDMRERLGDDVFIGVRDAYYAANPRKGDDGAD